jgi:hypothetical protein
VRTFLVLSVFLLAGCSADGRREEVRVSGLVRIGPTPGPCLAGTPCFHLAGGVRLVFSRPEHAPVRATSDRRGRYEVSLVPGTYRIRAANYPAPATILPATVTVESHRRLNLSIDSGVR